MIHSGSSIVGVLPKTKMVVRCFQSSKESDEELERRFKGRSGLCEEPEADEDD